MNCSATKRRIRVKKLILTFFSQKTFAILRSFSCPSDREVHAIREFRIRRKYSLTHTILYYKVPLPTISAFLTHWNSFCSILSLSCICLLSTVKYHDIYFIRRSYINLLLTSSRESTPLFQRSYNFK